MKIRTCSHGQLSPCKIPASGLVLQLLADIRPNEDHAKNFVALRHMTSVIQVMPEVSEHEVKRSWLAPKQIHCKQITLWTYALFFALQPCPVFNTFKRMPVVQYQTTSERLSVERLMRSGVACV